MIITKMYMRATWKISFTVCHRLIILFAKVSTMLYYRWEQACWQRLHVPHAAGSCFYVCPRMLTCPHDNSVFLNFLVLYLFPTCLLFARITRAQKCDKQHNITMVLMAFDIQCLLNHVVQDCTFVRGSVFFVIWQLWVRWVQKRKK